MCAARVAAFLFFVSLSQVPWVDTSSVLSDESVLTQWSVSTQRSMLSVGDFPIGKDMHSPIR